MRSPRPVTPRWMSAVRIDEYAYKPDDMSAIEMPTLAGASTVPVTEMTPDSACTSMSYALESRRGPSGP